MLNKIILIIIISSPLLGFSQTLKKVAEFQEKYQKCLNTGNGMKNCSIHFYTSSDSLLNVAYKNLKEKLNILEQNNLRTEQRKWLKKRDQNFKKAFIKAKEENSNATKGTDFPMFYFDKKSWIVIKRVKELIIKRNQIK